MFVYVFFLYLQLKLYKVKLYVTYIMHTIQCRYLKLTSSFII